MIQLGLSLVTAASVASGRRVRFPELTTSRNSSAGFYNGRLRGQDLQRRRLVALVKRRDPNDAKQRPFTARSIATGHSKRLQHIPPSGVRAVAPRILGQRCSVHIPRGPDGGHSTRNSAPYMPNGGAAGSLPGEHLLAGATRLLLPRVCVCVPLADIGEDVGDVRLFTRSAAGEHDSTKEAAPSRAPLFIVFKAAKHPSRCGLWPLKCRRRRRRTRLFRSKGGRLAAAAGGVKPRRQNRAASRKAAGAGPRAWRCRAG